MFGAIKAKILGGLGLAVLLAIGGLYLWGSAWKSTAERRLDKIAAMAKADAKVLVSIRIAADYPKLKWKDAADQVESVGVSRKAWRATSRLQSARIEELGMETARLKALNAELRRKAEAAIAKRNGAIKRLEDRSLTPGERSDCAKQLREAVEALDLVWEEGL